MEDRRIERLIVARESISDPLTARLRERLTGVPVEIVDDPRASIARERGERRSLVLMHRRGAFVKEFNTLPGAPACGERYLVTMLNCPFSCSYCYLGAYLEHRRLVVFTNLHNLADELETLSAAESNIRLTTGELGDSLALDSLTGTTEEILGMLKNGTVLDARTKSDRVDHLLHRRAAAENLVITWTLGPEGQITHEEPGTATLEDRIDAMRRAAEAGIPVGIRFDPIIPFYSDIHAYRSMLERIADLVGDAACVRRIELGVLRFPPGLWELVRRVDPRSPLLRGEYFRDRWGKIRLYRPARVALYRELAREIASLLPGAAIELSMEDRTVWEDAGIEIPGDRIDSLEKS